MDSKAIHFYRTLLGLLLLAVLDHTVAIGNDRINLSRQLIDRGAIFTFNKNTGQTRFIGTPANRAIAVPGTDPARSAEQNARTIMKTYGPVFGINNADQQLRLMKQKTQQNGRSMVRYQQLHDGISVLGGELIVNLDAQQRLVSINGETSDIKGITTTTPIITPAQAGDTALNAIAEVHQVSVDDLKTNTPELKIYDPRLIGPETHAAQLVWHIEVTPINRTHAIRELVLINALSGDVALHFNQIHTAKNRLTYDSGGSNVSPLYDNLPGDLICNEAGGDLCSNGANTEADNAHQFAGDTYDFFMTTHGRDSMDGNGGTIISSVNYCFDDFDCPMLNAFWNGTQMVYGAGFTKDDIVAHELTHAFTEHTSNLFYYYQSGAINESFSDTWGEFVDQTNTGDGDSAADLWYMGEDVDPTIFNLGIYRGAIRSMADPTLFSDPAKMTDANYYKDSLDQGGVHVNSGINNKAVYLMTDLSDKTFQSFSGPGIGIDKVAKIYYQVQTTLLTSGSDYADLYAALNQACINLTNTSGITPADCDVVKSALDAVEMNLDPNSGTPLFNPDAPLCSVGDPTGPTHAFYDNFESGLGKWSFSNLFSSQHNWQQFLAFFGVPNATSGTQSLFGEGIASTSDQRAEIIVTVPNRAPYLHFRHTYDFELAGTTYYDGGILEYSSNGGITWADASTLHLDGQDYNGFIYTGDSNPLAGRNAFGGLSHGFVSSRYDLSSLAGQQVRFRWRIGTDSINPPYEIFGWIIDDVAVYSCDNTAPTTPTLISPADNAVFSSNNIDFQWVDGTDSDSDPVTHTVLVCQGVDCLPIAPYVSLASILQQTPALAGLGAGGILLIGFAGAGRKRRVLILLALTSTLMLSASCGGGNRSTTVTGPVIDPVTITYRWRVQADDGNSVSYSEIRSYTVTN